MATETLATPPAGPDLSCHHGRLDSFPQRDPGRHLPFSLPHGRSEHPARRSFFTSPVPRQQGPTGTGLGPAFFPAHPARPETMAGYKPGQTRPTPPLARCRCPSHATGDPGRPSFAKGCNQAELTAVVFRDSFPVALEPFFSEKFKKAVYLWKEYDQKNIEEIMTSFKPDIVIELTVERFFFNSVTSQPENQPGK